MKIILGSSSKQRQKYLRKMGVAFTTMSADIDEKAIRDDDPSRMVVAIARAKADALLSQIKEDALLITADAVVTCNGEVLEKPRSIEEAKRFLRGYALHPAQTVSAIVVTNTKTGEQKDGVNIVQIIFKKIPEDQLDALIQDMDAMACSGAFSLDSELIQPYIAKVEGELESVEGLPKKLTAELLREMGWEQPEMKQKKH